MNRADSGWISITDKHPPKDVAVETKIDDGRGDRNHAKLVLVGNLWFFANRSMYIYYAPTHWRPIQEED